MYFRLRDWNKISVEDIETDIDVCFDNMRREIDKIESNEGKTLTEEEEEGLYQKVRSQQIAVDLGQLKYRISDHKAYIKSENMEQTLSLIHI